SKRQTPPDEAMPLWKMLDRMAQLHEYTLEQLQQDLGGFQNYEPDVITGLDWHAISIARTMEELLGYVDTVKEELIRILSMDEQQEDELSEQSYNLLFIELLNLAEEFRRIKQERLQYINLGCPRDQKEMISKKLKDTRTRRDMDLEWKNIMEQFVDVGSNQYQRPLNLVPYTDREYEEYKGSYEFNIEMPASQPLTIPNDQIDFHRVPRKYAQVKKLLSEDSEHLLDVWGIKETERT